MPLKRIVNYMYMTFCMTTIRL